MCQVYSDGRTHDIFRPSQYIGYLQAFWGVKAPYSFNTGVDCHSKALVGGNTGGHLRRDTAVSKDASQSSDLGVLGAYGG